MTILIDAPLMMASGASIEDLGYRFELVRQNTLAALAHIQKISEATKRANCIEVLAILDEKSVPAGHDV